MADGRTRSRTAPHDLRNLCDEPGIEDGADPRVFFRRGGSPGTHRSRRLCGAVHRTLSLCLSSTIETMPTASTSESVEPAPSAGWLLVVLRADRGLDPPDRQRLRARARLGAGGAPGRDRANDPAPACSRSRLPHPGSERRGHEGRAASTRGSRDPSTRRLATRDRSVRGDRRRHSRRDHARRAPRRRGVRRHGRGDTLAACSPQRSAVTSGAVSSPGALTAMGLSFKRT